MLRIFLSFYPISLFVFFYLFFFFSSRRRHTIYWRDWSSYVCSSDLQFTRPDSPVLVNADAEQLHQLLVNLVLNALDVMPQGGAMEIDLRVQGNGFIELRVLDTGRSEERRAGKECRSGWSPYH